MEVITCIKQIRTLVRCFNIISVNYIFLKLQSVAFLGLKVNQKYIFEKIHNQPVFKTICLP